MLGGVPQKNRAKKRDCLHRLLNLVDRLVITLDPSATYLKQFKSLQRKLVQVTRRFRVIEMIINKEETLLKSKSVSERFLLRQSLMDPSLIRDAGYAKIGKLVEESLVRSDEQHRTPTAPLVQNQDTAQFGFMHWRDLTNTLDGLPRVSRYPYAETAKAAVDIWWGANNTISEINIGPFDVYPGKAGEATVRFDTYRKDIILDVQSTLLKVAIRDSTNGTAYANSSGEEKNKTLYNLQLSISLECYWIPSMASIVPGMKEFMHLQIGNSTSKFEMWKGRGTPDKLPLVRAYSEDLQMSAKDSTNETNGEFLSKRSEPPEISTNFLNRIEKRGMCFLENALTSNSFENVTTTCLEYPRDFKPHLMHHKIYPTCLGLYPSGSRLVVQHESIVETPSYSSPKETKQGNLSTYTKETYVPYTADSTKETISLTPAPVAAPAVTTNNDSHGKLNTGPPDNSSIPTASLLQQKEAVDLPVEELPETLFKNIILRNIESSLSSLGGLSIDNSNLYLSNVTDKYIQQQQLPTPQPQQLSNRIDLPTFVHQAAIESLLRSSIEDHTARKIYETYEKSRAAPKLAKTTERVMLYSVIICEPNDDYYSNGFTKVRPGTARDLQRCQSLLNAPPEIIK